MRDGENLIPKVFVKLRIALQPLDLRLISINLRQNIPQKQKSTPKLPACPFHNAAQFRLHQKFPGLAADGMLQLFQFVLYVVQAINQPLKLL